MRASPGVVASLCLFCSRFRAARPRARPSPAHPSPRTPTRQPARPVARLLEVGPMLGKIGSNSAEVGLKSGAPSTELRRSRARFCRMLAALGQTRPKVARI